MTCAQGLLRLLWGGGRSWSATGLELERIEKAPLYKSKRRLINPIFIPASILIAKLQFFRAVHAC